MSDPLERLRGSASSDVPSLDAIKSRARRTQQRRYAALASGTLVVLLVAGIGLFLRTKPVSHGHVETASAPLASAVPSMSAPAEKAAQSNSFAASQPAPTVMRSSGALSADTAAAPDPLVVTVGATKHVPGEDFTLKVCNSASSSVTRSFPTTQRYDFEVSTKDGRPVWKWSAGQAFPDIVTSETWRGKECKSWTAHWDGRASSGQPATPGSYNVIGTLTSSPPRRTAPVPFCWNMCG